MTVDPSGRPTLDREAALIRVEEWGIVAGCLCGGCERARDVLAYEAALAAATERADRAERERDQAKNELRVSESQAVRESAARLRLTQRAVVAERRVGELQAQLAPALAHLDAVVGELAEWLPADETLAAWAERYGSALEPLLTLAASVSEAEPSVAGEPGTEQT